MTEDRRNDANGEEAPLRRGDNTVKIMVCLVGGIGLIIAMLVIAAVIILNTMKNTARETIEAATNVVKIDIRKEVFDNTERLTQLSKLELAERLTNERIEKNELVKLNVPFWGKTGSSAEYAVDFKVTYTYVVSMDRDKWNFRVSEKIAYIDAPGIEAKTPAIETSSVKAKMKGGWLVLDEKRKLEKLVENLTSHAQKKAESTDAINIVRENCRKSLRDFFQAWFVKDRYPINAIKIRFADEPPFPNLDKAKEDIIITPEKSKG